MDFKRKIERAIAKEFKVESFEIEINNFQKVDRKWQGEIEIDLGDRILEGSVKVVGLGDGKYQIEIEGEMLVEDAYGFFAYDEVLESFYIRL